MPWSALLAFYSADPEQLDRLFRCSALYRADKWGRRADYRDRAIKYALGNRAEGYRPLSRSPIEGETWDGEGEGRGVATSALS